MTTTTPLLSSFTEVNFNYDASSRKFSLFLINKNGETYSKFIPDCPWDEMPFSEPEMAMIKSIILRNKYGCDERKPKNTLLRATCLVWAIAYKNTKTTKEGIMALFIRKLCEYHEDHTITF